MRLVATAYCAKGPTKSGVRAQTGIVAADPRVLPIGTVLRIIAPGRSYEGIYTVMDTGSEIRGAEIDIFMPSCARAQQFGRRSVRVSILKHIVKSGRTVTRDYRPLIAGTTAFGALPRLIRFASSWYAPSVPAGSWRQSPGRRNPAALAVRRLDERAALHALVVREMSSIWSRSW